jgi:hypothetical protein
MEEFRLMPQPLYRFSAEKDGIVDGAVFAFAQANDPEMLLLLELATPVSGGEPAWRYSLARMSAVRMKARLDDQEIWSVEGYWNHPRSPKDPYIEAVEGKFTAGAGP